MLGRMLVAASLAAIGSTAWAAGSLCPGSVRSLPVNGHGLIYDVAAVGGLAVTIDQRGVTTWSIADPENPMEIGHLEIAPEWLEDGQDGAWDPYRFELMLHPSGEWGCIFPYLDCIDLREPARPQPYRWNLDEWPLTAPMPYGHFRGRAAWTDDAMAIIGGSNEIWLLDISENRPSRWIKPTVWPNRFENLRLITFAGDLLLALDGDVSLSAWDVSDLEHPVEVGTGTLQAGGRTVYRLHGHPGGAVGIATNSWPNLVVAISTSHLPDLTSADLSDRLEWSIYDLFELNGDRGSARMARRDPDTGDRIYQFVEVLVIAPLLLVEGTAVDTESEIMALTESRIVGSPGRSQLEVFTFDDQLHSAGATPMVGEAQDVAADDGIGVVANGAAGITVLDLADPERPAVLSTLRIDDQVVHDVEMRGRMAFILTDTGVGTVNLSRPAEPVLVAHRELDDVCCELELEGDLAIVGSTRECTMVVLDVSRPSHLVKTSETLFCDPDDGGDVARKIVIAGDDAYIDSWRRLDIVDVSDPWFPETRFNLFDRDLRGAQPVGDFLITAYGDHTSLCQLVDDDLIVGRTYFDLPAWWIDGPDAGLVELSDGASGRLVDFGDLTDPVAYDVPVPDRYLPGGEIADGVWLRPFRHRLGLVSLRCRPPEASFRWAGARLGIWFEDTTAYQVSDRLWDFGDGTGSTERAPFHEFVAPGLYVVTLRVSSANGSDSFSRIVDLRDVQRHGGSAASSSAD